MRHAPLGVVSLLALAACTDPDFKDASCKDVEGTCVEVASDDAQGLLDAANTLDDDDTLILGAGTFALDNEVTIRSANGVTLLGQGMGTTILDFSGQEAQSNGIDVIGDGFTIEGLTILDAKKDGLRIEDSDRIVIRGVEATWTNESDSDNGAYGLYPVKVSNVLLEDSRASNASDAGIYVGQCQHAIVRNNTATGNVAGIEIENTQYADVYGNTATDNTGGLLVFDLPGNPVIGHDIKIHDNDVVDNNRPNFAGGGTVAVIPAGTGTFVLASRRVEIHDNTYADNGTTDVGIFSGLVLEEEPANWALAKTDIVGDYEDLGLMEDESGTYVMNFRTEEIHVHGNSHSNTGYAVDGGNSGLDRELGFLVDTVYGTTDVDAILYDTIMESGFSATVAGDNSNDNHICVSAATAGTGFASLDLLTLAARFEALDIPTVDDLYRPDSPYAPFDCTGFTDGAIGEITVESP